MMFAFVATIFCGRLGDVIQLDAVALANSVSLFILASIWLFYKMVDVWIKKTYVFSFTLHKDFFLLLPEYMGPVK